MRLIVTLLMLVSIAGCTTFERLEAGLSGMMGKRAEDAFMVLGYPSGKQQFGADTVYYWVVNRSGAMILPQSSTTYGTVGLTPYSGTSYSTQVVPYQDTCEIKLVAGPAGILKHWEYNGNMSGCEQFASRLPPSQ